MSQQNKIVLVGGMAQRLERWKPQAHRGPMRTLLIVRNSNNTFTCTAPSIGVAGLGGTVTVIDLSVGLQKIGVVPDVILKLVAFFNATNLIRSSVEREFRGYEVLLDESDVQSEPKQLTMGF